MIKPDMQSKSAIISTQNKLINTLKALKSIPILEFVCIFDVTTNKKSD